ncbi:MAG: hypothetical protein HRT47_10095 [Candidatus Caenarcaniphilales bacterium]|nr:hypothetical protein [Candidatus Caenarcaniphilales bacterium]
MAIGDTQDFINAAAKFFPISFADENTISPEDLMPLSQILAIDFSPVITDDDLDVKFSQVEKRSPNFNNSLVAFNPKADDWLGLANTGTVDKYLNTEDDNNNDETLETSNDSDNNTSDIENQIEEKIEEKEEELTNPTDTSANKLNNKEKEKTENTDLSSSETDETKNKTKIEPGERYKNATDEQKAEWKKRAEEYQARIDGEADEIREYKDKADELLEQAKDLKNMDESEKKEFLEDIANFQFLVKRNMSSVPGGHRTVKEIADTAYRNLDPDDKASKVILRPWLAYHPGYEEFKPSPGKSEAGNTGGTDVDSTDQAPSDTENITDGTENIASGEAQLGGKQLTDEEIGWLVHTTVREAGPGDDIKYVLGVFANRFKSGRFGKDYVEIARAPNQFVVNNGVSGITDYDTAVAKGISKERAAEVLKYLKNPSLLADAMAKLGGKMFFRSNNSYAYAGTTYVDGGNRYGNS